MFIYSVLYHSLVICIFIICIFKVSVSVSFSIVGMNQWPKPTQGRKGLILLTSYNPSSTKFRVGAQGRNFRGWNWSRDTVSWLVPGHLLSLTFIQPRNGAKYIGLEFTLPPSIEKMTHRLTYRQIWWKQFLNWVFLCQDDTTLCQVDKN